MRKKLASWVVACAMGVALPFSLGACVASEKPPIVQTTTYDAKLLLAAEAAFEFISDVIVVALEADLITPEAAGRLSPLYNQAHLALKAARIAYSEGKLAQAALVTGDATRAMSEMLSILEELRLIKKGVPT